MPNLNEVRLMGNLTREPEMKYTPKGTAIVDFGMAINRAYTLESGEKREEVTFVDIEFWGKPAEIIKEYVKKGDPLFVGGRLKLDQWDDKQTGQKRSKLRIVGETFQFLKGKGDASQRHSSSEEEADARTTRQKAPATAPVNSDAPIPGLAGADEDEVPF